MSINSHKASLISPDYLLTYNVMFILLENLKKIQFIFLFFAGGEEKSIKVDPLLLDTLYEFSVSMS